MYYFALLQVPERDLTAEEAGREMQAYAEFHAREQAAIREGDALGPAAEAVRITGGPDAPVITDGPYAEGAEVAGGYYVFEADNLDDALQLARQIPAAQYGAIEVWPVVHWNAVGRPTTDSDWLALLLEPADAVNVPGTPEWDQGLAEHAEFGAAAGSHILGGAPLHPPATATTVRVRDGGVVLTDGPYAEGAEVANGFYVLSAADRDEATKVASMIPASVVELRRLAGVSGL
ncbi:transcription initiation protein [Mycolicibacterium aromaticivorans JS19b1 = JCM 16368]|uniref:Transcription initiation protein n=1 Tax=Mycolicibacterium aromaticivorans JS19b1 = JCM 16368 TaxID=1440774 RepID=A0A064CKC8_9MYCO|nr:YciI family protein [Mycolicibacterium aromaticivorans]KDE99242.1 transcription initiation protein [Mycolicibacterium aromaticivorans JS19b1 = JCM 16368]